MLDPRNKLSMAHMVLFSLAHDRFIDKFSMENGQIEINNFINFLHRIQKKHLAVVIEIIDLLIPAQRIIEIHLNDEFSIKEMIEVARSDFNKAIEKIGLILDRNKIYDVS